MAGGNRKRVFTRGESYVQQVRFISLSLMKIANVFQIGGVWLRILDLSVGSASASPDRHRIPPLRSLVDLPDDTCARQLHGELEASLDSREAAAQACHFYLRRGRAFPSWFHINDHFDKYLMRFENLVKPYKEGQGRPLQSGGKITANA